MTPNPTAQNSGLPNPSSVPSGNISSNTPSYAYPHQNQSLRDSSASRFNSFALPSYRSSHADLGGQPSGTPSLVHNPFPSNTTLADQNSRQHSTASTSNYRPQAAQQTPGSQLLHSSTTPSVSSFTGAAGRTAGGGGGNSAGSSVPNLSLGQVHLLIATINDRNYETKLREILRIVDSNMEINGKVLRKLINENYPQIISPSGPGPMNNGLKILGDTIKKIALEPATAKKRFADAFTFDTAEPSGIFRDFNLAALMECVGLDAFQRSVLAVGFKVHPIRDLQQKGLDILQTTFPSMLDILSDPSSYPNLAEEGLYSFLRQLLTDPSPGFLDREEVLKLSYAIRTRYRNTTMPQLIAQIMEPIEHLRAQESLAATLMQYGPGSIQDGDSAQQLLSQKPSDHINEEELAEALMLIATSQNPEEWNTRALVDTVVAEGCLPANFDWHAVVRCFDREDFILEGPLGLRLIIDAIQKGSTGTDFPIQTLWAGRWQAPRSQWSILRAYLRDDALDVTKLRGLRKVFLSEDFASANSTLKSLVATFETQKLISYDAVDALLHLALDDSVPQDVSDAARIELDRAAKFTPELILCGALMTPTPWSQSVNTVIATLFDMFFEGHTSYQLIFWRLWQVDKSLVENRFVTYYVQNPLQITRILDISQDLRCLSDLLEIRNPHFVLDVAALAARREYLNLEKWLDEMLAKYGTDFWTECYRFLHMKAEAEYTHSRENTKQTMVSLRVGPVHTFLTVLDEFRPPVNAEIQELVTRTQRICIQAYPRLINMGNGYDAIILGNNAETNSFPPHIDKDMQGNYRKLYAQETEIRDLVNYMQELKDSSDNRDQDLFACMIHGLFDEYDCYPNYPIHALATTSVLFGSIIRYKVIDNIPLRVALAMVYQAVRDHTTSSTMYKFGLQALVQFKERLREWRSYCTLLAQIPGLQGTDVWNSVQEVVVNDRAPEPSINGGNADLDGSPDLPNGEALSPAPQTFPAFKSICAEATGQGPYSYEDPDEDIQDKVLFIVNNVSQTNLDSKLSELREWLQEVHYQWFADYLVVKRAKLEPNYHLLYLSLLERFGEKALVNEVLQETYVNVIKLLNAESTLNNSTERTHLKNLGSWLGGLTIAKDKPIKFKNISFRDLIIEGWQTDRLIVVLPFTCKVLEQATKSTAFRPPNPWLMAIIRLLKELYETVALKLNLKFEIEVLCKNLDLDIKTVEPATDIQGIKDREAARDVEEEDEAALLQLDNLSLQQQHPQDYAAISTQIPVSFSEHIAINSVIRDPTIKRIIVAAIERTAHEIIGPVVERSVTIATIATSQLIQKDFGTEPDENKMRNAAIGMAQKLAGHLALVTCKEPMRLSMVNNIRNLLLQNGFGDASVSEQAVTMIVNDNLEYVCQTVESAAERGAVPQVDEALQAHYLLRKEHRARRTQAAFVAPNISRFALALPDMFRLKPGGLTPQQLGVYEEFARPSSVQNLEQARGQQLDGLPAEYLPGNLQGTPGLMDPPQMDQRQMEPANTPSPRQDVDVKVFEEKIKGAVNEMRKVAKESEERHIHNLRGDHPIFQYIDNILQHINLIPTGHKAKETVCTLIASAVCTALYAEGQEELEIESLVFLLRKLCEISSNTAKEVVMWLARDKDDERIFNVLTTVVLLRSQLLSVPHLDNTLAKLINAKKPIALEFLARLLEECQVGDPPLLYRTDFAASFNAVGNWIRQEPGNKTALALWNGLQGSDGEVEEQDRRDQMEYIFIEWVQLFQHISTTDKNYSAFIIQLHQGRILADLASSAEFFRTCIEFCIAEFESTTRTGASIATNCYIPTDALAKMVMLLVRYQSEDENSAENMDKAQYLDSLLALVVFIFNHHNETRNDSFCQKVFFRFFSSLLFEFRLVEQHLEGHRDQILNTFAECFLTLQPAFFPMFTFHWVTLIAHRYFMPKLLSSEKGQATYTRLLTTFLNYLGILLKDQQLVPSVVKILHQGALRLLLVIHHDFPGYLADYYFPIVDSVPAVCTQLRNLILSALPPALSDFPDPFANLQMKLLPEVKNAPKICGDISAAIRQNGIKGILDNLLSKEQDPFDEEARTIVDRLEPLGPSGVLSLDVSAINSLVLYLGIDAISSANTKGSAPFDPESLHAAIFSRLVMDLKPCGRHFFLGAITNHLRYPNLHTYYFSNLMVHLFDCVNGRLIAEQVREQIVRVLMERLVVHRPHPWGLIVALLDLFRSRQGAFLELSSVQNSAEIKRVLQTVLQQIDSSPSRQ